MIKSIRLENFQSHKDTELALAPGVNAIVGPSDSGKTAILRALAWLATNRPAGDAFRSSWGGDTMVQVVVDDKRITRNKDKRENSYEIDHDPAVEGDEARLFQAMGMGVPEPVAKALNMGEVNMQRQMDAPFLLAESPAEVARELNAVAGLDAIDRTMVAVAARIRQLGARLAEVADERARADEELAGLGFVDALEKKVAALEKKQGRAERLERERDAMREALSALPEAREAVRRAGRVARAARQLDHAMGLEKRLRERSAAAHELRVALRLVEDASTTVGRAVVRLTQARDRWEKQAPGVCPLCGGSGRLK